MGVPARADVVIVGGGHNALVAAAYLAKAGRSVVVLEREDHVGGAAVSEAPFPGVDARLSRYSYLVSLLPQRIIDDLGLDVRLIRRRYSSYTPDPSTDGATGLLIDTGDDTATAASFARIGAESDASAFADFYQDSSALAAVVFPSLLEPLRTRAELRAALIAGSGGARIWDDFIERPIGRTIERRFASDLVRGVVFTDGVIGTFADADDLLANRCLLLHVIGGGTGDWDVPIGGMGAVSGALGAAARAAGAVIATGVAVTSVDPSGSVRWSSRTEPALNGEVEAEVILSGVAPYVLEGLLAAADAAPGPAIPRPEGAQVKVNLVLSRLPRLRDPRVAPEQAFAGTFHIGESYSAIGHAFAEAAAGRVPHRLPVEVYCHTLSDRSILGPELAASDAQTLTLFGLHTPHRLAAGRHPDEYRSELQAAAIRALDSVLAEPIESLLLTDADGRPCIETKTTLDLEEGLNLTGGSIFHGDLSWPFLEDDDSVLTPAERWGVATRHPRILLCGSGARRGGAVSGIGGHNAAMAVLEA
ncbi:phytoene desaturase family protein [Naasia lichenicola]|uniref:NAD(P)/FAD-dependent oxidoreductase n=1 Tax=Naasia lichenicola TaxID=2565933 RepID=A0A4S4FH17_9MICO|nr:NAD(P)/FAD-dependent oxidoreductase [Naasia lichenicola]THG29421.1 NAD(P)/FAD-dependent oxidoreductase [Naasia lichenicola]